MLTIVDKGFQEPENTNKGFTQYRLLKAYIFITHVYISLYRIYTKQDDRELRGN